MPVAHLMVAEKRVVNRLKEAGAHSPKTACPLPDLRPLQRARLRHLLRNDIVHETGSEIYYLDEQAWEDHLSRKRRLGLILAGAMLILGFILFASIRK